MKFIYSTNPEVCAIVLLADCCDSTRSLYTGLHASNQTFLDVLNQNADTFHDISQSYHSCYNAVTLHF